MFQTIKQHKWSTSEKPEIRVALWNAGAGVWKSFLDVTEQELQTVVETNITAAFAFSRQALLAFKENGIDQIGKRGTLLFTGATASWRGNVTTSAFASGKFALRALSQSLNKEFGKQNIHVRPYATDSILIVTNEQHYTGCPREYCNGVLGY